MATYECGLCNGAGRGPNGHAWNCDCRECYCNCKCRRCAGEEIIYIPCDVCKGSGKNPCIQCRGVGRRFRGLALCSWCEGRGVRGECVKCSYNKRGFKAVKCPECRLLRVPGHDRHCTKCAGSGRLACIGCGGKGRIKLEEALAGLAVVENLFEVEDPGQEIPTLLKPCRELSQQDLIAALRCHEPGHEKVVLGSFKGMAVARDRVRLLGDEIEYSIYRVEPDQFVLRRRSNLGAKDAGRWYMTERYGRI